MKLVKKIVSRKGIVHFKRWSIWSTRWFNIYLHQINEADLDEDMHDHPWSFWSIILWGGYQEQLKDSLVNRRFLHMAYRKKNTPHKILRLFRRTWTLVVTGPGDRVWGYDTDKGWKDFKTYRKEKHNE